MNEEQFEEYMTEIGKIISLRLDVTYQTKNIFLINATMKLDMLIENFIEKCEEIKKEGKYYKTMMPLSQSKGRIGTMKIKPFENRKGTVHFDKNGTVQFFGFNDVGLIEFISEQVQNDIRV